MPRRRGGQPNNTNALKHGFYSRQFRQIDLADLDAVSASLDDEITLLRVFMRRLLEASQDQEETEIEDLRQTLSIIGSTSTKIATLLRTQAILTGGHQDDAKQAISQALAEVIQEMNLTP